LKRTLWQSQLGRQSVLTQAGSNGTSKFLGDVPPEIGEVLNWYEEGAEAGKCQTNTHEFIGNFLAGMKGDYALIPCPYQ
jgi:hypothetical protein